MVDFTQRRLKMSIQKQVQTYSIGAILWILMHFSMGSTFALPSNIEGTSFKLSYLVPKDTPYLFGHFNTWEKKDEQALFRFWQATEVERQAFWNALSTQADKGQQHQLKELNELKDHFVIPQTREAWHKVGIHQVPDIALYGIGIIPTLAFTVDHLSLFLAWIESQFNGINHGFEFRAHPRGSYWRRAFKRWTVVIKATATGQETPHSGVIQLSILPRSAEPLLLSDILSPPTHPMTAQVMQERLFVFSEGIEATGWIDLHSLIEAIFGDAPPALQKSAQAFSLPFPKTLMGTCGEELVALSSAFPMISLGASPSQEQVETLVHLHSEALTLFQGLQLGQEPFPNLSHLHSTSNLPALTAQFAFNPHGIEPLLKRFAQWTAQPWSCPIIKSLNRLALQPQTLAQLPMMTLFWSSLRGLDLHITEFPQEEDSAMKGWASLRIMNPAILWTMIQGMGENAPKWLQNLSLDSQGSPIELKDTPKIWHVPMLSSVVGGIVMSFDQKSKDDQVHQLNQTFFTTHGDPLNSNQKIQKKPVFLQLGYREDTAQKLREMFQAFKRRAQQIAQGTKHVDVEETEQDNKSQIKMNWLKDAYRELSLYPHSKGVLLRFQKQVKRP